MDASCPEQTHDVVVVGPGSSVAALRLVETGYRMLVLEAGRRFREGGFAATSWDARRFLFAHRLGCFEIQRIGLLRHVVVLAGAGVGDGSPVYANTFYEPRSDAFYRAAQWSHIADWRKELAPYYDHATWMPGVRQNGRAAS